MDSKPVELITADRVVSKPCSKCKLVKNVEEFSKDKSQKNGLNRTCKKCQQSLRKAHQVTSKGIKQRQTYSRTLNTRYRNAIRFAKYPWMLTQLEWESLIVDQLCHYCYAPLSNSQGSSLDRIDNSKGYQIGNVVPCCTPCNMTRGNRYTIEETEVMIDALMDYRRHQSTLSSQVPSC